VQGFLSLEACTFGGTRGQPFELVDAKQKCEVDKELERPSALRLGGPARIQQNEPRLLPAAAQFSTGHRKSLHRGVTKLKSTADLLAGFGSSEPSGPMSKISSESPATPAPGRGG
jgi:hypothetical protein